MRADMAKVIVERPRRGHATLHYRRPRGTVEQLEELPAVEGIRNHRRNRDWKDFSDLLGPLQRFVRSQIGRPWDKVYSEICERLKPSSTPQQHVLDHLKRMVATKTIRAPDGRIMEYDGKPMEVVGLHVDPDTGILREAKTSKSWRRQYREKEAAKPKEFIKVGDERELHKVEGVWYWAVFSDWPAPRFVYDKIETIRGDGVIHVVQVRRELKSGPNDVIAVLPGPKIPGERYRSGKRQASGRDLREHGVQNDVPDDE